MGVCLLIRRDSQIERISNTRHRMMRISWNLEYAVGGSVSVVSLVFVSVLWGDVRVAIFVKFAWIESGVGSDYIHPQV